MYSSIDWHILDFVVLVVVFVSQTRMARIVFDCFLVYNKHLVYRLNISGEVPNNLYIIG